MRTQAILTNFCVAWHNMHSFLSYLGWEEEPEVPVLGVDPGINEPVLLSLALKGEFTILVNWHSLACLCANYKETFVTFKHVEMNQRQKKL